MVAALRGGHCGLYAAMRGRHNLRGLLVTIVAGPIMLAAAVAALALLSARRGWEPSFLAKKTALDFLYGGGSASAVKFLAFAVTGVIAELAWFAIRWAFTGRLPEA